ncbi:DUF4922 domain-containing protein [Paenibacillus oleatilyticus]|uniref:Galactose-1-phosphate uridylyltransferase n=1 Tax=Paenibacillus oleatilyticus TaxID=2594886 RepID=A0ABV4UZM6_9BACL
MSSYSDRLYFELERLLYFGLRNQFFEMEDIDYIRNTLADILHLELDNLQLNCEFSEESCEHANAILENMYYYHCKRELNHTLEPKDTFISKLMGTLVPRPSEVIRRFWDTASAKGTEDATYEFYLASLLSNYIRIEQIRDYEIWTYETDYGEIKITLNPSVFENRENTRDLKCFREYPKCYICKENVGYSGNNGYPARHNHRIIPILLNQEPFYFQFSPQHYFSEHFVIFHRDHIPMEISGDTFKEFMDFLALFPHYFIGANADLPIVGGSILEHYHFQGGKGTFALNKAQVIDEYTHPDYPCTTAGIVKWPMSVIRIEGMDRKELVDLASLVLDKWRTFQDAKVGIFSSTSNKGQTSFHNTISPVARVGDNGKIVIDLILRNNRTDNNHPHGIFHTQPRQHHIKKNVLGVIDALGIAVLPGKLKQDIDCIIDILSVRSCRFEDIEFNSSEDLLIHAQWIEELITKYKNIPCPAKPEVYVKQELCHKFIQMLCDSNVFRFDQENRATHQFMAHAGFQHL